MLRVLSTLAVKGALPGLIAQFGSLVDVEYAPTVALVERLRANAVADLTILTRSGVDALESEGLLRPGGVDIAGSLVGLAVKAGAPRPAIATEDEFRETLLAARSICYSRIGASGLFFVALLDRLGLRDEIDAKAHIIDTGFTAEPVARGEAELAVQQVSELMAVPGITIVGPLPMSLQTPTIFTAAILTKSTAVAEAARLITTLASPEAVKALVAAGLLPPNG